MAMLLGVVLHAIVAYMHRPMDRLIWPVQESTEHRVLDAVFWAIHGFRVPLFFVVSGFFAAMLIGRRGPRAFLKNRWSRIGVPLVAATFTVLPVMYLIWSWGWVERGWAAPEHIVHVRFGPAVQPNLYGFAHLWFLEYLLIYCVGLWALRSARVRPVLPAGMAKALVSGPWRGVVLAAFAAAPIAVWPDALLNFHNGFIPSPGLFLHQLAFFVAGVVLFSLRGAIAKIGRGAWFEVAVAVGAGVWFVRLVLRDPPADTLQDRIMLAAAVSLFAAFASFGLIAVGLRVFERLGGLGRIGRFLADGSYWVYLTHPPWIGLAVVLMYERPMPTWVKAVIAAAVGAAGTLATFAVVRNARWVQRVGVYRPPSPRGGGAVVAPAAERPATVTP